MVCKIVSRSNRELGWQEIGNRKLEFQKPCKAGFSERSTQILLRFHAMEPRVIALFSKYVSSDHYENADTTHFESLVLLCKISPTWEAEKYLVPYWNGDGKD